MDRSDPGDAQAVAREERARRFVRWATEQRLDRADALLASEPSLAATALDAALVLGDEARVAAVLARDRGAATRAIGARDWRPLAYVCHTAYLAVPERVDGLVACARLLLDAGADPNTSWEHPAFGAQSALYGAAGVAHEPRMTRLLLEAGADPDDDESVYHATEEPALACLRLLLAAGARVEGTNAVGHALDRPDAAALRLLLAQPDGSARAPGLMAAAVWRECSTEVLELLAEHGADLASPGRESGQPPYALAVRLGRLDLAERLAALGAEPVASSLDELAGACRRGDRATAEAIVAADPRLRARLAAELGETLPRCAADGSTAAVELLHDLGVPLSARGSMGATALHWAAWWGRVETVTVLLDRGADVTATTTEGLGTPLDWAVHGSANAPRAAAGSAEAGASRVEESGEPTRPAPRGGDDHLAVAKLLVGAGAQPRSGMAEEAAGPLAAWPASLPARPPAPVHVEPGDPHGWGERELAAHVAYLRALASTPWSTTLPVGDGFAVRTGAPSNAENGVVCGAASAEEIAAALAFLRGVPAQWVAPPNAAALVADLVAAGAEPERAAVTMGAEVAALRLGDAPPPEDVSVARAALADDLVALATAWRWLDPEDDPASWRASLHAPGVAHYLASRHGEPAGFLTTFTTGDTIVGLQLEVPVAQRRHGIGGALVRAALAETSARYAIAAPTITSRPYLVGLGFTLVPCPPERVLYLAP